MSRKVIKTHTSTREQVGENFFVNRPLPHPTLKHFDPFLLLDQMGPAEQQPSTKQKGTDAHPHRGFITLSYILQGEIEHKDSLGNFGLAKSGGMQYMIAGSGIVHSEKQSKEFSGIGGTLHGFQLWINLSAKYKDEQPAYFNLNDHEIPRFTFNNGAYVKVLAGAYDEIVSPVKTYSPLFVYHIHLPEKAEVELTVPINYNIFAYVPDREVQLGSEKTLVAGKQFAAFDGDSPSLKIANPGSMPKDIMLYGGIPIEEPIVPYGPFVMNSFKEIQTAIYDYEAGKYGTIDF
ncbi:MAG: pirin family protein [bacterium]